MSLSTSPVATVAETEPAAAAAAATSPPTARTEILPSLPPPSPTRHQEYQYLDLVRNILANGEHRPDRTGTGTISLFAPPQLRFSLRSSFPLLTTKRVFTKAIIHELLWFISGSTSTLPLSAAGVTIWDNNGSRSALDALGFAARAVGDLGPVYGFQWRHFGAAYRGPDADYAGEGVDQLQRVVDALRRTPHDRRIILSAWNPADLRQMALPPCHVLAQFYVGFPDPDGGAGELSCVLFQRSCDMGLGVPFNIASYALLTLMLARACGLRPGEFVHTMGDAHVYVDHVDALKVQLAREPRPFPRMVIKREEGCGIDDFKYEDFEIEGYEPWPSIKMKMSV